ncbi:LysO family transporter [Pelotomaculum propionicicum]|uniref:LysO family transporter n=1 Tax=Pelotomaculum propionicicum TaxID=258475 RepID=UPI003B79D42A
MTYILLSLAAGIVFGAFWQTSRQTLKKANLITLAGLYFLLVVMGAQLGSNRELLSTLASMGKKAFIIAFLSIAGSVIALQVFSGFILKNLKTLERNSKAGE